MLCPGTSEKCFVFYRDVLCMDAMPGDSVARTAMTEAGEGFDRKIAFTTDSDIQMHLAERDLGLAFRNCQVIDPIERGHIAFRTDNIEKFKAHLKKHRVPYRDYRTRFAADWSQTFFHDPEGNVVEVHSVVV